MLYKTSNLSDQNIQWRKLTTNIVSKDPIKDITKPATILKFASTNLLEYLIIFKFMYIVSELTEKGNWKTDEQRRNH